MLGPKLPVRNINLWQIREESLRVDLVEDLGRLEIAQTRHEQLKKTMPDV